MNINKYEFIELYNMSGNHFYGRVSDFESAKIKLNELREKGELVALNYAVLMYCYDYDNYITKLKAVKVTKFIENKWMIEM